MNAERADARTTGLTEVTLKQFAAEFAHQRRSLFDRFVGGLNRLPRPMLAFGTIALFVAAMYDPDGFADRTSSVVLVPKPLWWLMGAIVSFYF